MAPAVLIVMMVFLRAPGGLASDQNTSSTSASPSNPATNLVTLPSLSPAVNTVVKLYHAGIARDVIIKSWCIGIDLVGRHYGWSFEVGLEYGGALYA